MAVSKPIKKPIKAAIKKAGTKPAGQKGQMSTFKPGSAKKSTGATPKYVKAGVAKLRQKGK